VSEVLALTVLSFQVECGTVAIRTLKRRRLHMCEVPLPPELIAALDHHFSLSNRRGIRKLRIIASGRGTARQHGGSSIA
jgi:hypothetical protein